jgi:hypothetical protein
MLSIHVLDVRWRKLALCNLQSEPCLDETEEPIGKQPVSICHKARGWDDKEFVNGKLKTTESHHVMRPVVADTSRLSQNHALRTAMTVQMKTTAAVHNIKRVASQSRTHVGGLLSVRDLGCSVQPNGKALVMHACVGEHRVSIGTYQSAVARPGSRRTAITYADEVEDQGSTYRLLKLFV